MPDSWWFIIPFINYSELVEHQGVTKGIEYIDGFKAAKTYKIELVVTIVINGWQSWIIVTKSSILDVAAVLNPTLHLHFLRKEFFNSFL